MDPVVAKAAFDLLILVLQKTGALTDLEAAAATEADNLLRFIDHIKTYSAPEDYDVKKNEPFAP